jgi:rhomboid protease GluP
MQLVEIYRSVSLAACEQRAFVLHAVGIASEIVPEEPHFSLWVIPESAATAHHHLQKYEAESAPTPPPKPALPLHDNAWITPTLYAVVVVITGYLAGIAAFNFDWYQAGSLHSHSRLDGEWWRTITALTLHLDHAHLIGNLGFGMFFGYLAARMLGFGVAFASMLAAAALGNALDSLLMPSTHNSVGASTMVFATLGLIAAYSWRQQLDSRLKWLHRGAPLIAGVMLLAFIGTGGERTDVLAHLTGFFCGALLGVAYARTRINQLYSALAQSLIAVVGVIAFAGAWWSAANS